MVFRNAFVEPELSVSSRLSDAQLRTDLDTKVSAATESLDKIGDHIAFYNDNDPVGMFLMVPGRLMSRQRRNKRMTQ